MFDDLDNLLSARGSSTIMYKALDYVLMVQGTHTKFEPYSYIQEGIWIEG